MNRICHLLLGWWGFGVTTIISWTKRVTRVADTGGFMGDGRKGK